MKKIPELSEISEDLMYELLNSKDIHFDLEASEEDLEVRLRYFDDYFELRYGDSQYDTDHRGFWGYSILQPDTDVKELLLDLYEQIIEEISIQCLETN